MRLTSILWVFSVVLAFQAYAQNISGSISGHVVDQQSAAITNSTVTAVDPARRVTVSTKTNEQGDFVFAALQPGNYTLSVEAPGFKKLERSNVPLDANDKLTLGNLTLEVGALNEAVEVSAQSA
jgi:hypothetical protein